MIKKYSKEKRQEVIDARKAFSGFMFFCLEIKAKKWWVILGGENKKASQIDWRRII